jgi:glyoxylase-like metal-dependent hydrolase (beta-lactamase superfamily II)
MSKIRFSRRSLIAGSAALAATGLLDTRINSATLATAMTNSQAPAFYRFRIGDIEATVVSDGVVGPLGEPSSVFVGSSKQELAKLLSDNYLAPDQVMLDLNALVINTDDRLVLFDTGMGSAKLLGPKSGRLLAMLKAAGIESKDIGAVVLTHAHPDHCWGLGENGQSNFPKAQIYMTEADLNFWTDEAKLAMDMIGPMIEGTRKILLPMRDRISSIKDGQDVVPGIKVLATPGHTVGHTSYLITSGNQILCVTGDVMHHHVLSVQKPRLEFAFDTDAKQGAATRLRLLDMLATDRLPFLTFHFPWPGVGHVTKEGEGFRYIPTPMQMAR